MSPLQAAGQSPLRGRTRGRAQPVLPLPPGVQLHPAETRLLRRHGALPREGGDAPQGGNGQCSLNHESFENVKTFSYLA